MELPVESVALEQLLVRALLDEFAVVEHEDFFRVADRGKAVRDDEGRAANHEAIERIEDHGFGFGINRGCRLVEDEDRRILEKRARDGDALPFAAGKLRAALADLRVVFFRQAQ